MTSGVLQGKHLIDIASGWAHSCAIDDDGAAYCWGAGARGRLGDGTGDKSREPVKVQGSGTTLDLLDDQHRRPPHLRHHRRWWRVLLGQREGRRPRHRRQPQAPGSQARDGAGTAERHPDRHGLLPHLRHHPERRRLLLGRATTAMGWEQVVARDRRPMCPFRSTRPPSRTSPTGRSSWRPSTVLARCAITAPCTAGGSTDGTQPQGYPRARTPTRVWSEPSPLQGETITQITDDSTHVCALTAEGAPSAGRSGARADVASSATGSSGPFTFPRRSSRPVSWPTLPCRSSRPGWRTLCADRRRSCLLLGRQPGGPARRSHGESADHSRCR